MKKVTLLFACLCFAACATAPDAPPYWLAEFKNQPEAKTAACLAKARNVYYENLDQADPGFARLHMGNAWESCMEKRDT